MQKKDIEIYKRSDDQWVVGVHMGGYVYIRPLHIWHEDAQMIVDAIEAHLTPNEADPPSSPNNVIFYSPEKSELIAKALSEESAGELI